MVKIFYKEMGKFFAFLKLHRSCPVCIENRKNKRSQKNCGNTRKGKVLNQPERFAFFFWR